MQFFYTFSLLLLQLSRIVFATLLKASKNGFIVLSYNPESQGCFLHSIVLSNQR